MNKERIITCAYCGQAKPWPVSFPVGHYAQCKECLDTYEAAFDEAARRINEMGQEILAAFGVAAANAAENIRAAFAGVDWPTIETAVSQLNKEANAAQNETGLDGWANQLRDQGFGEDWVN